MKGLVAFAFAALAQVAAASAQTPPGSDPAGSAYGADQAVQITATFRARIEGSADPRDVPSTIAQDTARRTLYRMAANECNVLSEFWKADCRLVSFSIYQSMAGLDGPGEPPSMIGTAVYELGLRSPGR